MASDGWTSRNRRQVLSASQATEVQQLLIHLSVDRVQYSFNHHQAD